LTPRESMKVPVRIAVSAILKILCDETGARSRHGET